MRSTEIYDRSNIFTELHAMINFARNSEKPGLAEILQELDATEENDFRMDDRILDSVHEKLRLFILPATPRGILAVEESLSGKGRLRYLGPVPLVQWLMIAAIVSLVATAASFAAQPEFLIDGFDPVGPLNGLDETIYTIVGVLFVISAAGLGASFYALFTAFRYVNSRAYDKVRNSTYLSQFVLGLVAGLILVLVLFGNDINPGVGTVGIAIVGGFSSDIVFRILTRLAKTVEFMILGEGNQPTNRPS